MVVINAGAGVACSSTPRARKPSVALREIKIMERGGGQLFLQQKHTLGFNYGMWGVLLFFSFSLLFLTKCLRFFMVVSFEIHHCVKCR